MAAQRLLLEHREAHALQAAHGAAEAAVDHLVREPDRLEDLRALVGLHRRDPHLRHDLEHSLRDGLAIVPDDVDVRVELPLVARLAERFEREIRIDAVRAVADEQAVVMHLARLAGLEHDPDPRALRAAHEMVVHRAAREQRAHGHAVGADRAVREHD